ncbi:prephenate dehydrogenase/arogenate dehydrogenase family protein (plasmid) [Streptomyces sp. NBC_00637]|uniref:prephenate dehydrogenase/arogenate dehydrogenase family protein n=1 Tax=Streptomyces sp. NBC_00637 TaxID=2903667 RepID=UPI002F90C527
MRPAFLRTAVVIGCGVSGTSIALALTGAGVEVTLADQDPRAAAEAHRLGAGEVWTPTRAPADIVVVATPPSAVVDVLHTAQARGLGNVYTDVAGTKDIVAAEAELRGCDLKGYVPGHPLPARGVTGRSASRFVGRPWILCPYETTPRWALATVAELVTLCGAVRRDMTPHAHDRAMAAVGHLPYVVAAVLAGGLLDLDPELLPLAGEELAAAVRTVGAGPLVGGDLLAHNAGPVADQLDKAAAALAAVARTLHRGEDTVPVELGLLLELGERGRAALRAADEYRTAEDARPGDRM